MQGVPWLQDRKQDGHCQATKFPTEEVLCGELAFNAPFGGRAPVAAEAAFVHEDAQFSAVASSETSHYTVVFVGTADGRLLKVRSLSQPSFM